MASRSWPRISPKARSFAAGVDRGRLAAHLGSADPLRQQHADLLVQGPQAVLRDQLSQLRDLFDAEEPGLSAGSICTRIGPDGGDGVLVVVGEDGDALIARDT